MERWKTQTRMTEAGVPGNCTQAALASLLDLPLDDVPDFAWEHKDDGHAGFYWCAIEDWCLERGFWFVTQSPHFTPPGYYLASGRTERGTHHHVVMKAGELAWDPHPSRAGLVKVHDTAVLIPLDPSKVKFLD